MSSMTGTPRRSCRRCTTYAPARTPAWFGEGDEKIHIDGERKRSIRGTGTEEPFEV
ncbi:MAG: DUF2961 domain-containing protein [Phycisphaerales bacterium]|nr:MAG: DUF2961 domain-containing protein [Phycisphaerales bacterium]